MQKITDAVGDKAAQNTAQLARATRLIRLITEMKTNPRQTPEHLYRMLGISKSQFFQDKALLESLRLQGPIQSCQAQLRDLRRSLFAHY